MLKKKMACVNTAGAQSRRGAVGSHRLDAWRPQTLVGTEVDPLLVDEDLLRCRHPPAAGQQRLQLFDAENVTGRVTEHAGRVGGMKGGCVTVVGAT